MKLTKLLIVGLLAIVPISAHAEVTDIKPDSNIGVYRQNENVSFTVTKDTDEEERFYYTLENMDGEYVLSDSVTATGTTFIVDIGIMRSGWYRMRLSAGGEEVPIFASFTVLPSTGTAAENSPFSGMLVSAWGDCGDRREDFAEALKLTGVNRVRDSALWCNNEYDYSTLSHIGDLHDAGNEQLLTVDLQDEYNPAYYHKDLFDVYEMFKNLAERFGDEVNAWDIINEPDIISYLPVDTFASFYKAAALGTEKASAGNEIAFGGLCAPTNSYSELLMQNDVMKYSTFMNVHSHTTASGKAYDSFPGTIGKRAKRLAALYGTNQPVWMTEAGMRMDVDENELPSSNTLREQAIYLTTSFAESINKYGTNNHFWFLMRHYIEAEKEFGMASTNYMTYPGWLAFANLAYNLGEGTPIGELSQNDGTVGYFFDTGSEDAAILWNKSGKTDYVQFKCGGEVKIIDVLGEGEVRNTKSAGGMVNIKVTSDPIIVRFGTRLSNGNYAKKTYPEYEKPTREKNDHIILRQVWDGAGTDNSLRVLNVGKEYTVTLEVYNFYSAGLSGTVDITADDNIEIIEQPSNARFMLAKYSTGDGKSKSFTYKIKLKDTAEYNDKGYIKFSVGDDTALSVCGYVVGNNVKYDSSTFKQFDNFWNKSKWNIYNRTAGSTASADTNTSAESISFTVSFNGGDRVFYPEFNTTVPSNSEGIVFTRTMTSTGGGGNMKVFAVTTDEKWFLAAAGDFSVGSTEYVIPWSKFEKYGGGDEALEPTKIKQFKLGYNTSSNVQVSYTISGFGTYGNSYVAEAAETLAVVGIEDGATYVRGNLPPISIDCETEEADLYVNFKKVKTVKAGEKISLNDVPSGACSVIAAVKDEFGKIKWSETDIYIRDYNDFSGKSAFY